jgi:alpha-glucosidase
MTRHAAAVPWWRDAVLYHIYVRSFADSNGDGIGDLPGIAARLDHLRGGEHCLGADAVWLSPFFPSPQRDFGYDIADHLGVDSRYGTLGDLERLIGEIHGRGMRVLIDLVLNHTSTAHPWFAESRLGRQSPKRDWYFWRPAAPGGNPPNNWLSAFRRCGSAWTWDEGSGEYYLSSFTPYQADLNLRHPQVRRAMWDIVRTWLDRGVDGFRVDVVHRIMKDPLLSDNPAELASQPRHVSHPTLRQNNFDHPDTLPLLAELRELVEAQGGALIGEVPIHDHRRLARYYGVERPGLHMLFSFGLWDIPWDARAFAAEVEATEASLPEAGWPCYSVANHDIPRELHRYGGDGCGDRRAQVLAVFLLTARGTPCIYYGQEIGLKPPGSSHIGTDVDGRDPSRTPMQWDEDGGGFGHTGAAGHTGATGQPWLPFGPELARRNVAVQAGDPGSMLSLYRRLIRLRASSVALRRGRYRTAPAPGGVYAYWREHGDERLLVVLNFASAPKTVETGVRGLEPVLATHGGRAHVRGTAVAVRPDQAVIVRLPRAAGTA